MPMSPIVIGVGARCGGAAGAGAPRSGPDGGSSPCGARRRRGSRSPRPSRTARSSRPGSASSVGSSPPGIVMLFACRTPIACCIETPASAIASGSRVMTSRSSRPPARSADATPGMRLELGDDLGRAISAASSRSVSPWADTDATTTGAALKLNEPTVGSTPFGSVAVREVLLDRGDGLVEVRAVVELGEDERERVRRRRLQLAQAGNARDRPARSAWRPAR